MKNLVSLAAAASLVVALPLGADASKARTVKGEYNTLIITVSEDPPAAQGRLSNGVRFTPRPDERFVAIEVNDDHTEHVRAMVAQDIDGDGHNDIEFEICDATETPFEFHPEVEITVWAQEGPCEDGTPAMSTYGKIKAVFTR